ncbi:MAG: ornithine carbamoyltransferase [Dehalococcoidales bacterium]|nr:ornithine carbamoyltransferase [Dehalococcoidales bacterium]
MKKDFLSISDLSAENIRLLIYSASNMKLGFQRSLLERKVLALVFEKPSLRTRLSFELAMRQLGGYAICLTPAEVGMGQRESVPDVARVLGRYVDVIAARTFSHKTLEVLAAYSGVPVINALSDLEHPCQALADLLTIYEKKKRLEGVTLAYIGDGNNVAHSLMLAASLAGMNFRIASPKNYHVKEQMKCLAQTYALDTNAELFCTEDPRLAVKNADVIYTDVWVSMGEEAEAEQRRQIFAEYQVNETLVSLAREDAIVMHPLPAHRGEEVSLDILDSPRSVVFDQAENRLHIQKALLADILGGLEMQAR